jgi:hypothetical protein
MKETFVTSIDLCVRGESLTVDDISEQMGFEPTHAFSKGDTYQGKEKRGDRIVDVMRTRATGTWHFNTAKFLNSNDIGDHVNLLIEKCATSQLGVIRQASDLRVVISIWVVGLSFGLLSEQVFQLSQMADEITVSCFEEPEI